MGRGVGGSGKRAVVTWSNFKPQNIAMLLWSFSKMETQPPAEVLSFLLKRAVKVCPEFTPSDVANYLYGLAKLNIKADEQLTQALEKRVLGSGRERGTSGVRNSAAGTAPAPAPAARDSDRDSGRPSACSEAVLTIRPGRPLAIMRGAKVFTPR